MNSSQSLSKPPPRFHPTTNFDVRSRQTHPVTEQYRAPQYIFRAVANLFSVHNFTTFSSRSSPQIPTDEAHLLLQHRKPQPPRTGKVHSYFPFAPRHACTALAPRSRIGSRSRHHMPFGSLVRVFPRHPSSHPTLIAVGLEDGTPTGMWPVQVAHSLHFCEGSRRHRPRSGSVCPHRKESTPVHLQTDFQC